MKCKIYERPNCPYRTSKWIVEDENENRLGSGETKEQAIQDAKKTLEYERSLISKFVEEIEL